MKAWTEFLAKQESALGAEVVAKWLTPLKVVNYDSGNLYLEAENSFQVVWFEEHVRPKLQLLNNNRKKIKVHLTAPTEKASPWRTRRAKEKGSAAPPPSSFALQFDTPEPGYTLSNFVVSPESLLTHRVLTNLIHHKDPTPINPVYIHGIAGTGKTHLLMAAANELQAQGLRTIYVRAETFTEHVVKAIRAGEMATFRQSYRNSDCLIVDDVHVFSRKNATQEEFFHTFNTLHLEGKQILLGANCAPAELEMIEPRLVSRFEWGIVLPLEPLTLPELRQVLQHKLRDLALTLPQSIADYLVDKFQSTHSLTKIVQALLLRTHQQRIEFTDLSLTFVKQLLADLILEEEKGALTPEKVIHYVARHFDLEKEDLLGKSQTRDCVLPRQIAMTICRTRLNMPYLKIGALFGRDHSTVMTSVKAILKGLEENEPALSIAYKSILKKL